MHLLVYWSSLSILNGIIWYRNTGQAGISPMALNVKSFTSDPRVLSALNCKIGHVTQHLH